MKSTIARIARFAKPLLLSAALALSIGGNAAAMVWPGPYGMLMSDTCIAPNGAYMIFPYQHAPVGTACWFNLPGYPGTFYGNYR